MVYDNFNDNSLTATWDVIVAGNGFVANEINDHLELTAAATELGLAVVRSKETHRLEYTTLAVEVVQILPLRSGIFTGIALGDGNSGSWGIGLTADGTSGDLQFYLNEQGSALSQLYAWVGYNPAQHRWWRLREYRGVIYVDVSEEGDLWIHPDAQDDATTAWKANVADLGIGVAEQVIRLIAQAQQTDLLITSNAIFDNLNISRVPSLAQAIGAGSLVPSGENASSSNAIAVFGANSTMTVTARRIRVRSAVLSGNSNMTANRQAIVTYKMMGLQLLSGVSNVVANMTHMEVDFPRDPRPQIGWVSNIDVTRELSILTAVGADDFTFEIKLGVFRTPPQRSAHILYFRYMKSSAALATYNITFSLYQGELTQIASWVHFNVTDTRFVATKVLTDAQVALITEYSDLRFRVHLNKV